MARLHGRLRHRDPERLPGRRAGPEPGLLFRPGVRSERHPGHAAGELRVDRAGVQRPRPRRRNGSVRLRDAPGVHRRDPQRRGRGGGGDPDPVRSRVRARVLLPDLHRERWHRESLHELADELVGVERREPRQPEVPADALPLERPLPARLQPRHGAGEPAGIVADRGRPRRDLAATRREPRHPRLDRPRRRRGADEAVTQPGRHRSSPSSPSEAGTDGLTGTSIPDSNQPFWLGANRGARRPSLISRVTAKRSNWVAGMNNRVLSANPSEAESTSPSKAETTPSLFVSIRATSAAYASKSRVLKSSIPKSKDTGRS